MRDTTETELPPLHPDKALDLVLENLFAPAREIVPLTRALGRYLAEPLYATIDQPPFDKSAMDGYAHCAIGPGPSGAWTLSGVVAAGAEKARPLKAGECARIMTGARIPVGTFAVQRKEFAREEDGSVWFTREESCDNIIRAGENQKAGDLLLSPRRLRPQDIGILAGAGYATIPVARPVSVGVVSTGNELAESGEALRVGAVYDSNGPQLLAQALEAGCEALFYGIVRDSPEQLAEVLGRSIRERDVTIVSGAVSQGDFDFVPATLRALGVQEIFHGLRMKPGKPTFYGRLAGKSVFALPGNPVSTFVNFELFVKPHLARRHGNAEQPAVIAAPMAEAVKRMSCDRVEYLPARIVTEGGIVRVRPLAYRGSSMLSALADADCLVRLDIGIQSKQEGETVYARLIRP